MDDHKLKRLAENEGALINTDKSALEAYKLKKQQFSKINNIETRMDNIENLLNEILKRIKVD